MTFINSSNQMGTNMIPIYMVGAPGIGKTSLAYALANNEKQAVDDFKVKDIKREVIYLPLSERDPMEIAGASYLENGLCKWAESESMVKAKTSPCVVILDELTAAHRVQRVAALRYADPSSNLHPETIVVATGNSPEYSAGAGDPLTAPEISRFRIISCDALKAVRWMCGQPGLVGKVGGFLRAHPNAALAKPEAMDNAVSRQEPFATPRGWTRAAESGLEVDRWVEIIGDAGPAQYLVWSNKNDLPDPLDILNNGKLTVPKRSDCALATATSIVQCLGIENKNQSHILNAIMWFDKASKKHAGVISCEADILAENYPSDCFNAAADGMLSKYADMQRLIANG